MVGLIDCEISRVQVCLCVDQDEARILDLSNRKAQAIQIVSTAFKITNSLSKSCTNSTNAKVVSGLSVVCALDRSIMFVRCTTPQLDSSSGERDSAQAIRVVVQSF